MSVTFQASFHKRNVCRDVAGCAFCQLWQYRPATRERVRVGEFAHGDQKMFMLVECLAHHGFAGVLRRTKTPFKLWNLRDGRELTLERLPTRYLDGTTLDRGLSFFVDQKTPMLGLLLDIIH